MSVNDSPVTLTDVSNLVGMDSRSLMSVGGGETGAITIPCMSDLEIDPDDDLTAVVSVRVIDREVIVTARITQDS